MADVTESANYDPERLRRYSHALAGVVENQAEGYFREGVTPRALQMKMLEGAAQGFDPDYREMLHSEWNWQVLAAVSSQPQDFDGLEASWREFFEFREGDRTDEWLNFIRQKRNQNQAGYEELRSRWDEEIIHDKGTYGIVSMGVGKTAAYRIMIEEYLKEFPGEQVVLLAHSMKNCEDLAEAVVDPEGKLFAQPLSEEQYGICHSGMSKRQQLEALEKPIVFMMNGVFNMWRGNADDVEELSGPRAEAAAQKMQIPSDQFKLIIRDEVDFHKAGFATRRALMGASRHSDVTIFGASGTDRDTVGRVGDYLFNNKKPVVHIGLQQAVDTEAIAPLVQRPVLLKNVAPDEEELLAFEDEGGGDLLESPGFRQLLEDRGVAKGLVDTYSHLECDETYFRTRGKRAIFFCHYRSLADGVRQAFEGEYGWGSCVTIDGDTPERMNLSREELEQELQAYRDECDAYYTQRTTDQEPERLDLRIGWDGALELNRTRDILGFATARSIGRGEDIPQMECCFNLATSSLSKHLQEITRTNRTHRFTEAELAGCEPENDISKRPVYNDDGSLSHYEKAFGMSILALIPGVKTFNLSSLKTAENSLPAIVPNDDYADFLENYLARDLRDSLRMSHRPETERMDPRILDNIDFHPGHELFEELTKLDYSDERKQILPPWISAARIEKILEQDDVPVDRVYMAVINDGLCQSLPPEMKLNDPSHHNMENAFIRINELQELFGGHHPDQWHRQTWRGTSEGSQTEPYRFADVTTNNFSSENEIVIEGFTRFFNELEQSRVYLRDDPGWMRGRGDASAMVFEDFGIGGSERESCLREYEALWDEFEQGPLINLQRRLDPEGFNIPAGFLQYGHNASARQIHQDLIPALLHAALPGERMVTQDQMLEMLDGAYAGLPEDAGEMLSVIYHAISDAAHRPDTLEDNHLRLEDGRYIFRSLIGEESGELALSEFYMPMIARQVFSAAGMDVPARDDIIGHRSKHHIFESFAELKERYSIKADSLYPADIAAAWDKAMAEGSDYLTLREYELPVRYFRPVERSNAGGRGEIFYTHKSMGPIISLIENKDDILMIAKSFGQSQEDAEAGFQRKLDYLVVQLPENFRDVSLPDYVGGDAMLTESSPMNTMVNMTQEESEGRWYTLEEVSRILEAQLGSGNVNDAALTKSRATFRGYLAAGGDYPQRIKDGKRRHDGTIDTFALSLRGGDTFHAEYIDLSDSLRVHSAGIKKVLAANGIGCSAVPGEISELKTISVRAGQYRQQGEEMIGEAAQIISANRLLTFSEVTNILENLFNASIYFELAERPDADYMTPDSYMRESEVQERFQAMQEKFQKVGAFSMRVAQKIQQAFDERDDVDDSQTPSGSARFREAGEKIRIGIRNPQTEKTPCIDRQSMVDVVLPYLGFETDQLKMALAARSR